jgi:translocation and assembly module TamB
MRRGFRIGLKILASLMTLLLILAVTAVLVLRSGWFHEKVRQRIVTELERATGGSATLGSFVFDWRLFTVRFQDLTLRGTEPASAPALLQARSIEIGLKLVSFWKQQVDVESVVVSEPKVNLIVAADGSTNVPEPKVQRTSGKVGLEPILDWKVAKFALEKGEMVYAEKRIGLDARGSNLRALLSYDSTGPRYKGQVSMQPLELNARKIAPLSMDVYLTVGLEKNRIEISNAKFDMKDSHLEASGVIEDLAAPKGTFRFTAHVAVNQAAQLLKTRFARRGMVELTGSAKYNNSSNYAVEASMKARDLDVEQDGIRVSGVRATSKMRINPRGITLDDLTVDLLGGRFSGHATLPELKRFVVDGKIAGIGIGPALATLAPQLSAQQRTTWSGLASGTVHVDGGLAGGPIMASANVAIEPATGGIPVQGSIDANYDGRRATLSLGKSHLSTPGVEVDVSGVLGEQLDVQLSSTNPEDLLPAINTFSSEPIKALPIQLKNGTATFNGTVTGELRYPQVAGAVAVTNFVYSGIGFDRFSGQMTLNPSSASLQNATLTRGGAQARIAGTVGLNGWKVEPANPISATVTMRNAEITELLSLMGQKQIPVRGMLAASARVSGTAGNPHASADLTVTKGVAYDEPFDRLQASIDYSAQAIKVTQAKLTAGPAQITGTIAFEPHGTDLRNGLVRFQVSSNDLSIQQVQTMKSARPDLKGMARTNVEGAATVHDGGIALTSLNGDLAAHDLSLEDRPVGNLKVTATTEASLLTVQLDSNYLNSNLVAAGQWRLVPGYPGAASARFSAVSLHTVRDWLSKPGEESSLSFDGSVEGKVSISGPAFEPLEWRASAELTKLEVYPLDKGLRRGTTERFTLRNQGPMVLTLANSVMNVSIAHFAGPSTDITLGGTVSLKPRTSLDLRVNGDVNLAVARNFAQDIETTGKVTINASIRGTPEQPLVNGQLDVTGGGAHVADITTGITNATGTILFNGSQATIQSLKGFVGGGRIALTGVVGYAAGDFSYRVDASAQGVRVRYPEGVSTSADAELSLRGSTQRSTLSGLITVLRTGFTPRTDFSSILGKASEPVRTPSARSGPLSGMQFDVRIETAPDISFESAFAQDIQVEGSLRLQGTPNNPVLLGRLNITEGEINFFGTKYTINQASITFANPVKLEPVLNVDLETRVQGIEVTLTVSGPIDKLNLTPRSDPPMQYSDVLALLATGAAPSSDPTLAAARQSAPQSFTQLGASALIGQVVANPVSSQLQRFFGVSKLRIDPQLTGVENNPQARLTVEQQVNKNVTFTYITNIATANQVIVRIEWALNKHWYAVAVRDENGLFGLDFFYKKRFK